MGDLSISASFSWDWIAGASSVVVAGTMRRREEGREERERGKGGMCSASRFGGALYELRLLLAEISLQKIREGKREKGGSPNEGEKKQDSNCRGSGSNESRDSPAVRALARDHVRKKQ